MQITISRKNCSPVITNEAQQQAAISAGFAYRNEGTVYVDRFMLAILVDGENADECDTYTGNVKAIDLDDAVAAWTICNRRRAEAQARQDAFAKAHPVTGPMVCHYCGQPAYELDDNGVPACDNCMH